MSRTTQTVLVVVVVVVVGILIDLEMKERFRVNVLDGWQRKAQLGKQRCDNVGAPYYHYRSTIL
jgi:hypothetical protein